MSDQWHEAAALSDLLPGKPIGFDIGEQHLILLRDGDAVRALQGTCPHAGAKLESGAICEGRLVCPWHMATFRITDGALLEPPALHGLTTYPTRVEDDRVLVALEPRAPAPAHRYASKIDRVVIVGSGAAAAAALVGLRDYGYTGGITVVGPEAEEPIDRTQLTKMTLAGKKPLETLAMFDADATTRLHFTRIIASVVMLDLDRGEVITDDAQRLSFDRCVIATGGEAKRATFDGADSKRIFTIRTGRDCKAILKAASGSGHVAILGTSFIALEAASALRSAGLMVTVVGKASAPFVQLFGDEVAAAIVRLHERNGVTFTLGATVTRAQDRNDGLELSFEDDTRLHCDFAVVGYGVKPRTAFARNLPQTPDGGIIVDTSLEARAGVYALGDVAAFPYKRGEPMRIEHWRVAEQHGVLAARNILGAKATYDAVPFFWTQQHGKRLVYIGHASTWDEIAVDGDLNAMNFVAWYMQDGAVAAALLCGKEHETAVLVERMRSNLTLKEARAAINEPIGAVSM